jgi:gamma-glutamylcyclotransferase (GGCT)/AIG2-like uncharacterized protein YtfP
MSEYLFSYGTLLPGHAPAEIAGAVAQLRPIGRGTVRGVLYDLGDYPGAVFDSASDKRVLGTVFRIPNDTTFLDKLDEYEGFDPSASRTSLFIRKRHPVRLSTGRTLHCWVYEYNGKRRGLSVLANGVYRARRTATG